MATTLYLRQTGSGIWVETSREAVAYQAGSLLTSRGSSAVSGSRNTVAGPTNGIVVPVSYYTYLSPPLAAALLMSGNATANLRMSESSMSANCGAAVLIERCDSLGNLIETVNYTQKGTELGTSEAAQNFLVSVAAAYFAKGDRIRVTVFADDGGGTMQSGYTASLWTDGPSAGASGDSYITFPDTLDFSALPAPTTTLYYRDDAADADLSGDDDRALSLTAGSSTVSKTTSTVNGPTAGVQVTNGAGQAAMSWWSKPLEAVTITAGSIITVYDSGNESSALAEVCRRVRVERTNGDGSSPTLIADGTYPHEVDATARTFYLQVASDVAISAGQRIHVIAYGDDASAVGQMLSGYGFYFVYGGTAGNATGVGFEQTITESSGTPKSGTDSGAGSDAVASLAAALAPTDAGAGSDVASLAVVLDVRTESGVATETAAVSVPKTAADAGTGSEVASLAAAPAVSDAGVGADTSSAPAVAHARADAGAGSDTAALTREILSTDAGAGGDTSSAPTAAIPGVDAGAGADTASLAAAIPTASDAGAGADTSTLAAGHDPRTEVGAGADTATLTASPQVADAGTGADATAALEAAIDGSAESGSATDSATVDKGESPDKTSSDAGVGDDVASLAAAVAGTGELHESAVYAANSDLDEWGGDPSLHSYYDTGEGNPSPSWHLDASVGVNTQAKASGGGTFAAVFGVPSTALVTRARLVNVDRKCSGTVGSFLFGEVVLETITSTYLAGLLDGTGNEQPTWHNDTYGNGWQDFAWAGLTGADSFVLAVYAYASGGSGATSGNFDNLEVQVEYLFAGGFGTATATLLAEPAASAEAGAGTETAYAPDAALPGADAAVGSDTATVTVAHASSDAGVGSELASVDTGVTEKVGADAGAGTDAVASLAAALDTRVDAGVAEDYSAQPAPAVLHERTEAGVGSEAGAVSSPVAGADAGAGADVASLTVEQPVAEVGYGTETATVTVQVASSDAGVAADAEIRLEPLTGPEAGTGADVATLAVGQLGTDTGTGTDTAGPLEAAIPGADAGVATDAASVSEQVVERTSADAGVGSDVAYPPAAAITGSDGSTGAGPDKLIITYDRAYAVDDVVSARDIGVYEEAFGHDELTPAAVEGVGAGIGGAAGPNILLSEYRRKKRERERERRKQLYVDDQIARSLAGDLVDRYGLARGDEVYKAMEEGDLGPFAEGNKYAAGSRARRRRERELGKPPTDPKPTLADYVHDAVTPPVRKPPRMRLPPGGGRADH